MDHFGMNRSGFIGPKGTDGANETAKGKSADILLAEVSGREAAGA